ncbi:MAG: DNA-directed RNA polymerase subunit delta [bacterium]|nr:DNA-directed RNA polymerase subunit delta [bacterium]
MNLKKLTYEELEQMSYTQIAKAILEEKKKPQTTAKLFTEICRLLELSEKEYEQYITEFFHSLTNSKEFILLPDGNWDLKSNHTVKVKIDDIYDDEDEDIEELENDEEIEIEDNEEDEDSFNSTEDDETYDDDDDDLGDLTIINDDELEQE